MIAIPQPQSDLDWIQKETSRGVIKNLSTIQLVCSFLAVISEIVQIYGLKYFTIGTGLWTGLTFGINGVIGLFVAKQTSKCNLIALFIMSIISIIFCYILICFGILLIFCKICKMENFGGIIIRIIQFIIGLVEARNAIGTALLSCHVIPCGR